MKPIAAADFFKSALFWLMTSGQTVRRATEQIVLDEVLGNAHCQTAADIGCGGGGYLLRLLAPRTQSAFGIEIDEDLVNLAARRISHSVHRGRLHVVQGSVERMPLAAGCVDLVLCTQVLEHVPDPARAIGEIHRILRPSGRAVLAIPIQPDPCLNPGHVQVDLTPGALDAVIAANGFLVLHRRTCMFVVSRAVIWLTARLRMPLPLVPLCRLEQASAAFLAWPKPYVYICVALKQ